MKSDVTVFSQYSFSVGQKIRIEKSRRAGDWQVAAVDEKSVTLKCPISGREFTWDAFCYYVEEEKNVSWPKEE